jgi:hypothetical protein
MSNSRTDGRISAHNKGNILKYILTLLVTFTSLVVFAEFESPLEESFPPIDDQIESFVPYTSTHEVIAQFPGARSQKSRGTCTMFTTIGMVEHLLVKKGTFTVDEIDLSEEWMEYIMMKDRQKEGSSTSKNLRAVLKYGVVHEGTWPYLGKKWEELSDDPLAEIRCGHLTKQAQLLQSCLLGHRDPRLLQMSQFDLEQFDPAFISIKAEAQQLKSELIDGLYQKRKSYILKRTSQIKSLLAKGVPLIMGTKLYYGSWNSKKTEILDIQKRDKSKWYAGIVSYPEPGSRDRRISGEKGGGHSVIIVGYDDDKEVTSRMLMEDGTWKEFTYRGVYYFRNSWGVRGQGKRFEIDGKPYPGYGMITQKYAHEFGTFYHVVK